MRALPLVLLSFVLALPEPGHAGDRWRSAKPMSVVMVDNRFEPDHLTFQAGAPYALHVTNSGKELHEFTAPGFFRAARLRDKHQLANGGIELVLQPGQSATILLIAPPPGRYDLTCADHDWDGMVGQIEVQ